MSENQPTKITSKDVILLHMALELKGEYIHWLHTDRLGNQSEGVGYAYGLDYWRDKDTGEERDIRDRAMIVRDDVSSYWLPISQVVELIRSGAIAKITKEQYDKLKHEVSAAY